MDETNNTTKACQGEGQAGRIATRACEWFTRTCCELERDKLGGSGVPRSEVMSRRAGYGHTADRVDGIGDAEAAKPSQFGLIGVTWLSHSTQIQLSRCHSFLLLVLLHVARNYKARSQRQH